MTFGQKLKYYRSQLNITQKELADELNVTFQTISKWESDINEPDFANVRKLAKILNCTIEDLLSDTDEGVKEIEEAEEAVDSAKEEIKIIATCIDCGEPIKEGEIIHRVERKTNSGVKELVCVCDKCFKKHEEESNRRAKEIEDSMKPKPTKQRKGVFHKITSRNDRKPLIWAIVLGIVAAIIGVIVSVTQHEVLGTGLSIVLPFVSGYCVLAVIYCIFAESYISDVFMEVASWSIRFPGLIWQFSLDGFIWLIAMKILFAVVGFLIGVAVFLLALSLATVLSVVSFIPILIYNKKNYYA